MKIFNWICPRYYGQTNYTLMFDSLNPVLAKPRILIFPLQTKMGRRMSMSNLNKKLCRLFEQDSIFSFAINSWVKSVSRVKYSAGNLKKVVLWFTESVRHEFAGIRSLGPFCFFISKSLVTRQSGLVGLPLCKS